MSEEQNPKIRRNVFVTNGYRPVAEVNPTVVGIKGGYAPVKGSRQPLPTAPKGGTGAAGGAVASGGKK